MRALFAPAISGLTNDYVMVAHIGVRAAFLRADEMLELPWTQRASRFRWAWPLPGAGPAF
jgi:hypothetical protein